MYLITRLDNSSRANRNAKSRYRSRSARSPPRPGNREKELQALVEEGEGQQRITGEERDDEGEEQLRLVAQRHKAATGPQCDFRSSRSGDAGFIRSSRGHPPVLRSSTPETGSSSVMARKAHLHLPSAPAAADLVRFPPPGGARDG